MMAMKGLGSFGGVNIYANLFSTRFLGSCWEVMGPSRLMVFGVFF